VAKVPHGEETFLKISTAEYGARELHRRQTTDRQTASEFTFAKNNGYYVPTAIETHVSGPFLLSIFVLCF